MPTIQTWILGLWLQAQNKRKIISQNLEPYTLLPET
jgi:hypothetical protein